ncbi:MAG: hypothetical protein MUC99_01615 [Anaerolineae bacterium]|jgi:CheY-like chemotaxis protein|nr:hypothetical protein [Anaerolineae bacterium]
MLKANPRILLLDDEPDKAHLLMPWLKTSGIEVEYESTAHGVIERLRNPNEKFDVLVLDMMMPGSHGEDPNSYDEPDPVESGKRLHRIIRADLKLRDIPIIFLSVVRDTTIRDAIRQEEAKHTTPNARERLFFVSKPVLASALIDRIRKVFRS